MAGERYQDQEMADAGDARGARLRSTVTAVRKQKGRGFRDTADPMEEERGGQYESVAASGKTAGVQKSVEGWVIFVSNLHDETSEEDLTEAFSEFGTVKNLYMPLDRRTGFVKGYSVIEYATAEEAQAAIDGMNGQDFLEQPLAVSWCFSSGPSRRTRRGR